MSTPNKTDTPNPFAAFGSLAGGGLLFGAGSGDSGGFSFNASTFGTAVNTNKEQTPKKDGSDDDDDGEDGDDDAAAIDESHAADFKPLVNLEKVEVKSGEEDFEVTFKSRSKLFVFVKEDKYGDEIRQNWWRERGLGEVKILKNKTTSRCMLLMRQEKTLKVCMNHTIAPNTELKPQSGADGKAWMFTAVDFANENNEPKTELFAIKFGTADTANDFRKYFEEAKTINNNDAGAKASPAKPAQTSAAAPGSPAPAPAAVATPAKVTPPSPAKAVASAPLAAAAATAPSPSSVDAVANQVRSMNVATTNAAEPPRAGGFQKRSPDEAEVKKVADFACSKINQGQLVKIASVKSQVVAGMNYRMALHIKNSAGAVFAHVVTVYQPLPHMNQPLSMSEHSVTGQVA